MEGDDGGNSTRSGSCGGQRKTFLEKRIKRPEDVEQELNEVKAKLSVSERDKIHALEELKRAMQAEEHKKKAMEDLAAALKEVAAESSLTKDKLVSTEQQLEAVKEEAKYLKKMIESTEETYEALFKEQKKENDHLINVVNRLRVEAEESHMAWSCKELEFVKCLKKSEGDKNVVEADNNRLIQCLQEAQETSEKYKGESNKLRDILKQAINEASVAREAASLARTENSFLKDALADTETGHVLGINDAEANLNMKDPDKDAIHILEERLLDVVDSIEKEALPDYPRTSSGASQNLDDTEMDRKSQGKKKALMRKFGELLRGKSSRKSKDMPHEIPTDKGIAA